jgi:hypothetical protein
MPRRPGADRESVLKVVLAAVPEAERSRAMSPFKRPAVG